MGGHHDMVQYATAEHNETRQRDDVGDGDRREEATVGDERSRIDK